MIAGLGIWRGERPALNAIATALAGSSSENVTWLEAGHCSLAKLGGTGSGALDSHFPTVLYGWIDNKTELAEALGLPSASPEELYAAAYARWGDEADSHVIGSYCAITCLDGGRLRLVRSPWTAPPLHFVHSPGRTVASNVLPAIFASGHPREIDYDYLADQLAQDHHDGETCGWYQGVNRVPIGCEVIIGPEGERIRRYYDPLGNAPVHFSRGGDYVEAARALIDEAGAKALAVANKPGLMLSGGLDSAIVAESLLRQLPDGQRLPSFTFVPDSEWDGIAPAGRFGDDGPYVRAFAAMHPGLDASICDPAAGGFDYRLRDMFAACGATAANVANIGIFHGPWQAAKDAGCDVLLNAELGNFTFSNDGTWSYVEYFKRGHWRKLHGALKARTYDPRPYWRQVLAVPVLSVLPASLRGVIRKAVGSDLSDGVGLVSLLTPEARRQQQERARRRGIEPLMANRRFPLSREEWIMGAWHSADSGEDLDLGLERLYGMRRRDVTAYRPLIEFCMGLPTDQFVRDGTDRYLARRLAEGRMPENQRLNPLQGQHNVDWHARLGRRRAEIARTAQAMRAHPVLREMIDFDRLQNLLADWPENTPRDLAKAFPRMFALTRALTAASFVGYVEGRNDF